MVAIIGIIASLTVLGLSLIITRIATTALSLTGLSWEAARFQARSAFTGTGFTTTEAESVVNHPVRRRIIMSLMIARSAGFISIIISLILSFGSTGADAPSQLNRLLILVAGVIALWFIASSKHIERWMKKVIQKALKKWTNLEVRDYVDLFKLTGPYTIRELHVKEEDWLAGKTLNECRLNAEGVLILGIYRRDGSYLGAPTGDTKIFSGDTLILYGRDETLVNLDKREAGQEGEAAHEEAIGQQKQEEADEAHQDDEYRKKREQQAAGTGSRE